MTVSLFRIVTERDEIIVGFTTTELDALGGRDAPDLARVLIEKGTLPAWQYAVGRKDGGLAHVAQSRIGLMAHGSLRIEPYSSAYEIIAPAA